MILINLGHIAKITYNKDTMYNIGILTHLNDQLLPFLIKKIHKLKNINFYLIVSKTKKNNTKSLKIFKERTGDYFLKHNFDFFNLNIKLPIYFVESHNSKDFIKIIKNTNIKFLYNSNTPNKINKNILKSVKGVINIHPGILPYYQGCTCVEWALFNNDPLGVTAHFMDDDYDSGPIIQKKILRFKKKDIKEYKDIRIKIFLSTLELAKITFKKIINKDIKLTKQDANGKKYYNVIKDSDLLSIKRKIKNKSYKFNIKNLIR